MKVQKKILTGGAGNRHDGNTAKKYFSNTEVVAEATKVDPDVIEDIHTILVAFSCTQDICPDKLKVVCYNLYTKLTNRYYWYKIPQAIHKMIFYSHQAV